jgi:hypothetical protein
LSRRQVIRADLDADPRKRQRIRMPEMARERTCRWISLVPSKIV